MTLLPMIEAVVARQPRNVAIEEADGAKITYAALFERARAVARTIPPETRVHVVDATRSSDFIAACLGAWLAGAAWVPLDAAEPPARREAVLARLATARDSELAYVIPTSGSSGVPKAVMVTHRGVPALVRAQIAAFQLTPGARSLWLHAPIFDASLSDWGTALASGATLVIPSPRAVAALERELSSRAITHVDLPPALLPQLGRPPECLRVVVLGGETCPVDRVRALAKRVRVIIVYGPTEATVCSSLVVVDPATWTRPLIGDPIEAVTYEVIDGELQIAGPCLALGYAGDPAETARCFVERDGVRWYRTGDRVERVPEGLAFVGRLDRQHKISGRRVELAEIETVLRRAPGVIEAAVAVRSQAGRRRLVAFVEGAPIAREWLRNQLPAWMIPPRIVTGALPRTPTGKIDHAALASGQLPAQGTRVDDALTAELVELWCETLGVESVASGDRFREAGGDSLAGLMLQAAAVGRGLAIDAVTLAGNPCFGDLVARARRAVVGNAVPVAECERRGVALLQERKRRKRASSRTVVLFTGATGMLGRHLLRAWRARDDRDIVALVREPTVELRRRLGVELLGGDLALPRFGGSEIAWANLAAKVSAIVHAGAVIQLSGDWDAHAAVNVGGTAEIARLACEAGAALHHVSTLSVFVGTDRSAGHHVETSNPDPSSRAYGGYAQTKIAAEAIARATRGRPAATTVFRLGLLVEGDPRSRTQLGMTIRGLARLGAVPAGASGLRFDVTPNAYAAQALTALALDAEHHVTDRTHHIASARGVSFAALVDALRMRGICVADLPAEEWASRARDGLADPDIAMAYLALGRAHADESARDRMRPFDLFLATDATFDVERTHAQVGAPEIDLEAVVAAALEVA